MLTSSLVNFLTHANLFRFNLVWFETQHQRKTDTRVCISGLSQS